MGANFGDLDNDGFLDFYLGHRRAVLRRADARTHVPERRRPGASWTSPQATGTGHLQKGHGVAFADLDNDGDEDVFANLGGAFPGDKYRDALFENPGHGARWLSVRLVGTKTNRAAIGARIRLVLDEGGRETQRTPLGHERRLVRRQSPLTQHVGIGDGARLERVEVDWPGARSPQIVTGVSPNTWIEIVEGQPRARLLTPPGRFRLGGAGDAVR